MKNNVRLILLVLVAALMYATGCSRPLHDAVDSGRESKFNKIMDSGVDVNEVNIYGDTALHRAAYKNRPLMADALIQKGANVYALNAAGHTPIELAYIAGNKEVAVILDQYMSERATDSIDGVVRKKHILVKMDANADGVVDESEYIMWNLPQLHEGFTTLDANADSKLTASELTPLDIK